MSAQLLTVRALVSEARRLQRWVMFFLRIGAAKEAVQMARRRNRCMAAARKASSMAPGELERQLIQLEGLPPMIADALLDGEQA